MTENAGDAQVQGPSSEEPYRVGPGRPPREHQWKPGQSGNPGGRKKGESLTAMLRRVLEREHQGRPIGELLVERLVKEALSGKLPHLKEVLDRVEGRALERMKLDAQVQSPGLVVLPIPLPQLTGNPEVDRLLNEAHREQVRRGLAEVPEGAKVLTSQGAGQELHGGCRPGRLPGILPARRGLAGPDALSHEGGF